MTTETRLKQLRDEFDRLTRSAEEHGYAQFQRRLDDLSKEIKQEEYGQRLISGAADAVEWFVDDELDCQEKVQ